MIAGTKNIIRNLEKTISEVNKLTVLPGTKEVVDLYATKKESLIQAYAEHHICKQQAIDCFNGYLAALEDLKLISAETYLAVYGGMEHHLRAIEETNEATCTGECTVKEFYNQCQDVLSEKGKLIILHTNKLNTYSMSFIEFHNKYRSNPRVWGAIVLSNATAVILGATTYHIWIDDSNEEFL